MSTHARHPHSRVCVDPGRRWLQKTAANREEYELEFRTTEAARKVARETGLFHVPEILEYNDSECWISYEFLPDLKPLASWLHDGAWEQLRPLMRRAGAVLAAVHGRMRVDDLRVPIPEEWAGAGAATFLHGDYTMDNVLYDEHAERIVVIDWNFCPLFKPAGNWGTVCWDVVWMLNSLLTKPPYFHRDYAKREQVALMVLRGYCENVQSTPSMTAVRSYCWRVFRAAASECLRRKGLARLLFQFRNRYSLTRMGRRLVARGLADE